MVDWFDVFMRKDYAHIVCDPLNHGIAHKGLVVHAWVITSNHIHLIARGGGEGGDISAIIRDFKSFTAMQVIHRVQVGAEYRREWMLPHFAMRRDQIKRVAQYKFWQGGSHAILLVDTNEKSEQCLNYLDRSLVAAGIVAEPEYYLLSSAADYAGIKGSVDVVPVR